MNYDVITFNEYMLFDLILDLCAVVACKIH